MSRRLLRALRIAVLVIALTAVAAVAAIYGLSERRLRARYPVNAALVPARFDSAGIARGRHLYRSLTCALCHAEDGGGAIYSDAGSVGILAGPNLTRGRGGVAPQRTDQDLVRAIRHGVRPDSTSLLLMPSEVFVHLSDADLGAILGYVVQLRPVNREVPRSHFRWLGRALLATGRMNILVAPKTPAFVAPAEVTPGPTAAYGRYLADISGCHGCHGYGLSGGAVAGPPGLPPASNLTPAGIGSWTERDFSLLMREGKRPNGGTVHEFMPWRQYRNMNDEDLSALWQYLRSVPAKAFGGK